MAEERFASLGRVEAVARLFDGTGYKPFESTWFETKGQAYATQKSRCFIEGTDFDLVYFPLKHLGHKCVTMVTGELYAELSSPRTLAVVIGVPAKLDFSHIKELWSGIVACAKKHGYEKLSLEVMPSMVGLSVSVSACGETSLLTAKRRAPAKSMDLLCVSGSLGGAYLGLSVLEREKRKFDKTKDDHEQPQLDKYKDFVGEYLKPSLSPNILKLLEDSEIVPSFGYFVTRGLAASSESPVSERRFTPRECLLWAIPLTSARNSASTLSPPPSTEVTTAVFSSPSPSASTTSSATTSRPSTSSATSPSPKSAPS